MQIISTKVYYRYDEQLRYVHIRVELRFHQRLVQMRPINNERPWLIIGLTSG